jgi:hypothetical protein
MIKRKNLGEISKDVFELNEDLSFDDIYYFIDNGNLNSILKGLLFHYLKTLQRNYDAIQLVKKYGNGLIEDIADTNELLGDNYVGDYVKWLLLSNNNTPPKETTKIQIGGKELSLKEYKKFNDISFNIVFRTNSNLNLEDFEYLAKYTLSEKSPIFKHNCLLYALQFKKYDILNYLVYLGVYSEIKKTNLISEETIKEIELIINNG